MNGHSSAGMNLSGIASQFAMQSDFDRAKIMFGCDFHTTFRVCIYACRFLDFRVRRFDNKLQVAFDSVRCWFFEVLLTSKLGR